MPAFTSVDKNTCIACGSCGSNAPDIFDYDAEGLAGNILDGDDNLGVVEVPEHLMDELDEAQQGCPTASIRVENVPFSRLTN